MASNAPPTDNSSTRPAKKLPRTPPEERFWKRYSPHGELPLSGVGSLAVHALVLGTLVLWSWLLWNKFNNWKPDLPVDTVQLQRGGGGGSRQGVGDAPGVGRGPKEAVEANEPAQQRPPDATPTTLPPLPTAEAQKVQSQFEPATAQRFISKNRTEAMDSFVKLDDKARTTFRPRDPDGVQPGKGQGGTGSGGGLGEGRGTGEGSGTGPGKAKLTKREERMLRWSMRFNTQNGADYVSQLKGLGAILAIPVTDGPNPQYEIIRNLDQRPPKLLKEDLSKIQRIYWVDDKPNSVAGVMDALGLQMRPSHFVAFMPEKLEQKLFKLELNYKGLREDQIHETKFEVVRGRGGYEPRVIDQVPKSAVGR